MYFVGIDPGLDGGIAFLRESAPPTLRLQVFPIPTIKSESSSKTRSGRRRIVRSYNPAAIVSIWDGQIDVPDRVVAVLERAQAMSRWDRIQKRIVPQGAVSNFTTGLWFGWWVGFLASRAVPTFILRPQVWHKMLVPAAKRWDKLDSFSVARDLFPRRRFFRTPSCKVEHDGMCEAALLAHLARTLAFAGGSAAEDMPAGVADWTFD